MDFAEGNFVGYLEIDTTLVLSTTDYRYYYEDDGDSTCDDSSVGVGQGTMGNNMNFGLSKSPGEDCYRGAAEFDISSILDGSTITNVSLDLDIDEFKNGGATSACDIRSLTAVRPTVDSAGDMFTGIDDGTLLVNDNFCNTSGGSLGINTIDLGSVAVSELENQLTSDWFALGFHQDNDAGSGLNSNPYYVAILNDPELTVTYSVPLTPNAPTNLSTVTGVPVELDWDSPVTTVSPTPTTTYDLSSSTGFTTSNSGLLNFDTVNEEIDFIFNIDDGGLAQLYHSATVSDSLWTLRSQIDIDTISQGSDTNDKWLFYGFSSANTLHMGDSQDFLGMAIRVDNTKTCLLYTSPSPRDS